MTRRLQKRLVALVCSALFVATLPLTAAQASEPRGVGNAQPKVEIPANKIRVEGQDAIYWNGVRVSLSQLSELLSISAELEPEPVLTFEPDANASYELSAKVLRQIKASGVTKFGFVGNERYRAGEASKD